MTTIINLMMGELQRLVDRTVCCTQNRNRHMAFRYTCDVHLVTYKDEQTKPGESWAVYRSINGRWLSDQYRDIST